MFLRYKIVTRHAFQQFMPTHAAKHFKEENTIYKLRKFFKNLDDLRSGRIEELHWGYRYIDSNRGES